MMRNYKMILSKGITQSDLFVNFLWPYYLMSHQAEDEEVSSGG